MPGEHLAGIGHHGHVGRMGHAPLDRSVPACPARFGIAELQLGQGGFRWAGSRLRRTAPMTLARSNASRRSNWVQLGRIPDTAVCPGPGCRREGLLHVSPNAVIKGSRSSANLWMLVSWPMARDKFRLLGSAEDGQHVVSYLRQERRVVPSLLGVDVAHVLEPEVVGTFPGGRKVSAPKSPVRKARPSNAMVWSWPCRKWPVRRILPSLLPWRWSSALRVTPGPPSKGLFLPRSGRSSSPSGAHRGAVDRRLLNLGGRPIHDDGLS